MAKAAKLDPEAATIRRPFEAGVITRATYAAKAADYVARGKSGWFMVRNKDGAKQDHKPETPRAWCAWLVYFRQISVIHAFAASQGIDCVPAEYPWEFDAAAAPIEARMPALLADYQHAPREEFDAAALETPTKREPILPADWKAQRERQKERADKIEEMKTEELGAQRKRADDAYRAFTYRNRGVEEPVWREGQIGMTLEMMISMGWEISEQEDGRKILVRRAYA